MSQEEERRVQPLSAAISVRRHWISGGIPSSVSADGKMENPLLMRALSSRMTMYP